ncbi:MAG: single-stranded DNA-binding protein [Magnetospirillum sp.]
MFNQNFVALTGRLGADAEIKTIPSGRVGILSLAVDHNFKNNGGKWQTATSWFRIVTYMPWLIDNVLASEATKGRPMFIQGSLRSRSWDQNGKTYSTVEIEVDPSGGITPVHEDSKPVNLVQVIGRLGDHANIKTLPGQGGGKMASFNLAASRSFKDSAGQWQNATDWLRVFTFQPSLIDKTLAKTATKGRLVLVQGALRAREWADEDGEIRKAIEIEVDGNGDITPVLEDKP